MVPTDIPTAAVTPSLSVPSITPPTPPRLVPRLGALALKRLGTTPRTPKRSRSAEDDDAYPGGGLESLRRYTSNEDLEMDGVSMIAAGFGPAAGVGTSSVLPVPVPAPRPVIRARSSKKPSRTKIECIPSSSSAPDISSRVSPSRASPTPEPAAKRQRSGSTSSTSSLTGILVADKDPTPPSSSPTTETTISAEIVVPVPSRPAKPLPSWSYTPSPLATAPVMSLGEPPPLLPNALGLRTTVHTPAQPAPEQALPLLPLTPEGRDVDVVVAAAQLTKARAFWRDVEDLGAELGNVLRLGLGRGMNRGKGGERRPSRLRSTLSAEDDAGGREKEGERSERERSEDEMGDD